MERNKSFETVEGVSHMIQGIILRLVVNSGNLNIARALPFLLGRSYSERKDVFESTKGVRINRELHRGNLDLANAIVDVPFDRKQR